MPTPSNTNTATPSVLDDVQKTLDDKWANLQSALDQRDENARKRVAQPDAPGTTYDDILKSIMPEKPLPAVDPKREKARAWVTNIGDAINAVGGIIGAASGADVVPATPLSAVNQQRYNKLLEQQSKEQEAYNRAIMQSQSHAMSLSEAYRRQRQQRDAEAAALDDAAVSRAKAAYDKALDDYNRIYRQGRDATGDERNARQESRQEAHYQSEAAYREQQGNRTDLNAAMAHNKEEEKLWVRVPGGKFVRAEDYPAFAERVYKALLLDKDIKAEIEKNYGQALNLANRKNDTVARDKLLKEIVEKYLDSSDIARQEAEKSGKYGTPDFWPVGDYNPYKGTASSENSTQTSTQQGGKKTIPGF